ncbi:MAG: FtsX-like permease family protein, partial [Clostridia bacterium]
DKLVIMVTHNSELADKYATRIVKLSDGELIDDNNPFEMENIIVAPLVKGKKNKKKKKVAMSFITAMKLSFQNLRTKKGRTIITSIAGSIGIIGVALVLAISNGMGSYVNTMQKDTLSGFPITISQGPSFSMTGPKNFNNEESNEFTNEDILYPYDVNVNNQTHVNDINQTYVDYVNNMDSSLYNSISLTRLVEMNLIMKVGDNYKQINNENSQNQIGWQQLPSEEFLDSQYDLLAGDAFPNKIDEIALIVDANNYVDVKLLTELGIAYQEDGSLKFDEIIGTKMKIVPNDDFYTNNGNGIFMPNEDYGTLYNNVNGKILNITSIIRVKENSSSSLLKKGIAYTQMLVDEVLDNASGSIIVKQLRDNPTVSVFDGTPLNDSQYENMLKELGGDSTPTGINIYPVSFESKDAIKEYLDAYNVDKEEEEQIIYNDLAELISETMSTMINAITMVLTAVAAISLVVSTIMIGIIIYVSVVERTKEIGVLRSIGARKKDITRVFSAESIIIGFFAGVIGVIMTYILSIPINIILSKSLDIQGLCNLPIYYGIALLALSMVLTFLGGIIPARGAAQKDPVTALRTE